jgi:hypothetical protein
VAPPSGTGTPVLTPPAILSALALWLNASITTQTAAEITANLFIDFMLQSKEQTPCQSRNSYANIHKHLSTNKLTT